MKPVLLLLVGQLCLPTASIAEEVEARDSINPKLTAKAEALIKSALKVKQEDEGVVSTTHPGHSYAPKTQILFFRRRGTRIEMIATGVFTNEKVDAKTGKKEIFAELDRDNIIKYPHEGDYAVPMNDPNLGALDGKNDNEFPAPEEPIEEKANPLPGYIEYGMGLLLNGSLNTTPSGQVNISKITSGYRFIISHFAYYSHYIPIGFELDSYKGNFPTKTRESKIITSDEAVSFTTFTYRFKPFFNDHVALSARVRSISDTFNTNNTDDSLLTSTATGMGYGVRGAYDLVSPAWKKEPNEFFIQLQNIYGEFLYYPSITVKDKDVSRGTSSDGSTMMQYRIGATALAWISFIPIFKRWFLEGSYGMRSYKLKFSGATVSEEGNPITVSENGTSSESEKDYRVFFGIRLDDPVKMMFSNDEKKEK